MDGTIGTTRGFGVYGAGLGLFLGGILSLPWMLVTAALIWAAGDWIDRHPVLFALAGPTLVIASWHLLTGGGFDRFVTVSCATSALVYLLLSAIMRWGRWPDRRPPAR